MPSKKPYMFFVLLAFSISLAASGESSLSTATTSDDESRTSFSTSALLSALEASKPITISGTYSSMRKGEQWHEITTPKGTIVLKGSIEVSSQEPKVNMQSSSDGQYVFVESGQSNVRVFTLSPKKNTFVYTSTFSPIKLTP